MHPVTDLAESLAYVEEVYARFREDPEQVSPSWQRIFQDASGGGQDGAVSAVLDPGALLHVAQVFVLVNEYRVHGHLAARVDPLDARHRPFPRALDPATYGFTEADLDRAVPSGDFRGIDAALPLRELLRRLEACYCRSIGVEFMHIADPRRRRWLVDRIEPVLNERIPTRRTRRFILERLVRVYAFERYLHKKFVGTKRFSIEGSETLLPLLDLLIDEAGARGIVESVIGMPHRGRLSILHFLMGKSAGDIFSEFEDISPESVMGGGDVKYHLGASHDYVSLNDHSIHLSLCPNPSHLEAVDPIVLGRVRAKQHRWRDFDRNKAFAILVHGDAAFAGQGLVAECLNLSELWGYKTGGTVHVVVNNQIGFTTAPAALHSTEYASNVAQMLDVPIFHVNAEDLDAVAHVAALAVEYRQTFNTDVVIDLFCFRRYGHTETDDPAMTQPLLYARIAGHPAPADVYAEKLVAGDVVARTEIDAVKTDTVRALDRSIADNQSGAPRVRPRTAAFGGYWKGFTGGPEPEGAPDTGVSGERLAEIAASVSRVPDGFHVHRVVGRLLESRAAMGRGEVPVDWAMAETLAFGSLALDGAPVRMSGQDSRRGTFSQRHAAIIDQANGAEYVPLQFLAPDQAEVLVYDSMLSEAAVLGFELGFSFDYPEALVLWEAQFGDFANGAQVIIDQFLVASEDKWNRISGLVLLLPHGYEGQGPEHSSARLERWLQLAGQDNIQLAQPSRPAQYFHLLRRQVLRPWRKPLIVLTPKSLLRDPRCVSALGELSAGTFQRVLLDPSPPENATTIVFCSGRLYYDLERAREERGAKEIALVRVEQLYPLPEAVLAAALAAHPAAEHVVWAQDEPVNMGAWNFLSDRLRRVCGSRTLRVVARAESASPATGSHRAHEIEQTALMEQVFQR